MTDPFARRDVEHAVVGVTTVDIDRFILGDHPEEKRWEGLQLTQKQDAQEWIDNPDRISGLHPYIDFFADTVRARPCSVLDVGCYGGYLLDFLIEKNAWDLEDLYHGIDVNEEVVLAADAAHDVKMARFAVRDVFKLKEEMGPATYDLVWCSRLLIHLPHFERALLNLLHVTKHMLYLVLLVGDERCEKIHVVDQVTQKESFFFYRTVSRDHICAVAGFEPTFVTSPLTSYTLVVFRPGDQA